LVLVKDIGIEELAPGERRLAIKQLVGFVLAMYRAAQRVFSAYKERPLDERWIRVIVSRLGLLDFFGPMAEEDAPGRLAALKADLFAAGRSWEHMSLRKQFTEICVTVLSAESWDMGAAMPGEACKAILSVLAPMVFEHVPWEL